MRYFSTLIFLLFFGYAHAQTPLITRGPYWQVITPNSAFVRWRTDQPTTGRIWFGTDAAQLTNSQRESQPSQEHSLTLTGLQPNTRYTYAVGYDDTRLASGADYYIKTAPPTGSTQPFRLWVLGDFGFPGNRQIQTYQAYRSAISSRPADAWLWLGDNAYCCGTEDQYQRYVFDVYGPTFRNTPIIPSPGNHDYNDSNTNFDVAYYRLFSMPQRGEAGGVASGKPTYFSVDYGNLHIVSLDSQGQQTDDNKRVYDTTSVQIQWLKRDLTANRLPWTIVIFHHPPYTKGTHDSDTQEQLRLIRQNLTPIFEQYGVDLVLNGHSHVYERFYRMRGHTGLANSFDPTRHIAESTTARYDGSPNSCPILTKGQGTVYVVNGAGGAPGGQRASYPMPAMLVGNTVLGGSMLVDVNDNRLDAQYILEDGSVFDRFTVLKNVNKTASLTAEFADTLQLLASWPGEYRWTNGQTGRSIRYIANQAGTFPVAVTDNRQCLNDQFNLTVQAAPKITTRSLAVPAVCVGSTVSLTATPENTTKAAGWQYDVLLSDAAGNFAAERVVGSGSLTTLSATIPATVSAGTGYRLRVRPRGISYAELIPSAAFAVRPLPTATLSGTATVLIGEPASVTATFTGDAPWQATLSDGTAFTAHTSPSVLTIKPLRTDTYTIQTIENACGKGTATGQANIIVLFPTATQGATDGRLLVYPNPTRDVIVVELALTQRQAVRLNLTNTQGKTVFQKQTGVTQSVNESIKLPATAGTYLLTVQIGSETLTRKVVRE
ncbi:metallophosphoesterase [Spirosoma montaniterrae]|uniref:Metallophosphoesterase n=1 Tax=Spirosoma montaniterrae TaxID=1178516 RepID=A0A1P9WX30_9BACT|nr:metallophosphoesterase [Spirosoma montaniterrae]AQG79919.1 metallophosphoesterase [Spirosoma montaniterrae]